jgi:hypothetical protein
VSATAAATQIQGSYDVNTAGQAFSFSESFTLGDAVPSGTTVTSGVVGSLPSFGSVTTSSGGVAGSLAGTLSGYWCSYRHRWWCWNSGSWTKKLLS